MNAFGKKVGIITLKHINTKCMFLSYTKICEASKTNSADPDQTAPVGAV